MTDMNAPFFTCCRPRWDAPNGFLAISSLLPRFFYESLRSHNGPVNGNEVNKFVMQAFSHIAQIIGWNKEITETPEAISYIDSIQHMRIQSYYRNAAVILNGKYSIKDTADAIHGEGTRSAELSFCHINQHSGCKYRIIVTATCLMFSQGEAGPEKEKTGVCYHNIKAGISASSSAYPNPELFISGLIVARGESCRN